MNPGCFGTKEFNSISLICLNCPYSKECKSMRFPSKIRCNKK
jgi:hypothetical protein